jgi:type II secretory pathway component PulL
MQNMSQDHLKIEQNLATRIDQWLTAVLNNDKEQEKVLD